jgi:hypothetical protein
MEQTLTPEESLQIIQKSISHSRRNMRDGSFYFLLWGWVLILAAFTHYLVMTYLISREFYEISGWISLGIWLFFVAVAFIWQSVKISRENRKTMVKTNIDRHIGIIWYSAGITIGIMVFFSIKLNTIPVPFILAITALATFVSGMMVKYRPLILGGLVFAIASVIAIHLSGLNQILITGISLVLGYLIPGYMLRTIKNGDHV